MIQVLRGDVRTRQKKGSANWRERVSHKTERA
jgi:hypothetical protein